MYQYYYISLLSGIAAIAFSFYAVLATMRKQGGNARMQEIADDIRSGASAYLNRQFVTIGIFVIVISLLLSFALRDGLQTAIAFVAGAATSYFAAYLGMNVAVRANVRTAKAAEKGVPEAFAVAIIGGSVTGFAAVGLGLAGLSILLGTLASGSISVLIGFAFGASLVSLFARVGGGIFTKSADVGADLVGKTELGLPEDDPRNPAVIADNVGDNVGDCAGMSADVYESYVVTIIAALLIAVGLHSGAKVLAYPLYIASSGIIVSLIGMRFLKAQKKNATAALYKGISAAIIVSGLIDFAITIVIGASLGYFAAVFSGLILALLLFAVTDYYTGSDSRKVIEIASAAKGGAGTCVVMGLAAGLQSTLFPVVFVAAAMFVGFYSSGVYGIALSAVGLLSIAATILTIDSFGPITDNAGGIAEMAGMPKEVRKVTDSLDSLGNTTKALTKGYAIGGAALSAVALFVAFAQTVGLSSIDALDPTVTIGIFLGVLLPFIFSSFLMESVGVIANLMVEEVRRQVKSIKGLMSGQAKPDYARAVDIVTVQSLRALLLPELLVIATPIVVGLLLGKAALGGLLVGMIPASFLLALFQANSGAAMDNAKKYIEAGHFGGKGSEAHKASVVGDTVGDPLKDTAGPALNSMIKVVSTLAILLAPLFLTYALL